MKTTDLWKSHTFSIKNKAFKEIRPLDMTLNPEVDYESIGFKFWKTPKEHYTGRYVISLRYDRGPLTFPQVSHIYMDSKEEAWTIYRDLFQNIFVAPPPPPPPPPGIRKKTNNVTKLPTKKKSKTTPLRLL